MRALAVSACVWAFIGVVIARIYDRCELAQDFIKFGIPKAKLATWVCIAYHESRFDTAAHNAYSGDFGILQISELFWCGPGKECGVPCSAFQDDNIKDDVKCALQVYDEHQALQGNGFKAWVVYEQHCQYNVKKYLADCPDHPKSPRHNSTRSKHLNISKVKVLFPNIDNLKLPNLKFQPVKLPDKRIYFKNQSNLDIFRQPIHIEDLRVPTLWLKSRISTTETNKFNNGLQLSNISQNKNETLVTTNISEEKHKNRTDDLKTGRCYNNQCLKSNSKPNKKSYFNESANSYRPTKDLVLTQSNANMIPVYDDNQHYLSSSTTSPSVTKKNTATTERIFYSISTTEATSRHLMKRLQASNENNVNSVTLSKNEVLKDTMKPHKFSASSSGLSSSSPPKLKDNWNIFDLYLKNELPYVKPTQKSYSFQPYIPSKYKVVIFANGTTTSSPFAKL